MEWIELVFTTTTGTGENGTTQKSYGMNTVTGVVIKTVSYGPAYQPTDALIATVFIAGEKVNSEGQLVAL